MANTRRKTSIYLGTHKDDLRGLDGRLSKYITAIQLHRQEVPSFPPDLFETVVPQLAKMATTAAALHVRWSGSTVSVTEGSMAGLPRFAVSTHPERTVELAKTPTWNLLFAFAVLNSDLLLLPDHAMGTWCQSQRKRHVLDVVVCPSSLDEAIRLGIHNRQEAIYDLERGRDIPLLSQICSRGTIR